jgi:acyl-coenzyme A synthetase/AMP-(fatty) acid ligase
MFCGEVMPNKQLNVWRKALPKTLFANLYGPCEAVDASTYYIVDREFSDDEPLPIGVSCRNTDIILLDEEDNEVHGDGLGEICIRGSSLAMGYLNNPDRTSSAFTYNPLNSAYPEMIYRTGDLARYNEYGELMYAGRKDFQIKHMGHRIELGEIETAVDSISEIEVNACIYDEVKHRIVLYYTGHQIDDEYINDVLSQKVTDYMMPNDIIYIEKFPYNANGKIDRKELKRMYYDRY